MPSLLINDFSGGKNNRVPANRIADNELQDIFNMEYTPTGGLRSRNGRTKYNSVAIGSAGKLTGIFLCKYANGTRKFVVSEGTGYYVDDGAASFSSIKTGLTSGRYPQMAMLGDLAVFVNGAEVPQKYDATTVANLGGSPPADPSMICAHRNHLFMAGASADPFKIYASAVNDPEDWTTPNDSWTGYCGYQDGDPPIGMISFMDTFLYVFKRQAIWRIIGSTGDSASENIFTPERVAVLTGTVSQFSIVPVGSDVFFFDVEGIKSLADTERAAGIEYPNLTFRIQDDIINLNQSKFSQFYAANHKQKSQYWCCVANAGQANNNRVIILDYALRTPGPTGILLPAVTIFDHPLSAIALIEESSGNDQLYGGDTAGFLWKLDTGNSDGGANFIKYAKTKAYDFNSPDRYKAFKYLFARIKQEGNYNVNINWSMDLDSTAGGEYTMSVALPTGAVFDTAVFDTDRFDSGVPAKERILLPAYGSVNGQNIAFQILNSNANQPFEIIEMVLTAEMRGHRHY